MSNYSQGVRLESRVGVGDPDFIVRAAEFDDLDRLVREAKDRHLPGSWSSVEAMANQVAADSMAFLCPAIRNGGGLHEPESYRCHVWFVERSRRQGLVSLFDVTRDSLESLHEVSDPAILKKVIRYLLDSYPLSPLI